MKTKSITITQTTNKEGVLTNFKVVGFTDWEVMGLLSYYQDAFKVQQLTRNKEQEIK